MTNYRAGEPIEYRPCWTFGAWIPGRFAFYGLDGSVAVRPPRQKVIVAGLKPSDVRRRRAEQVTAS